MLTTGKSCADHLIDCLHERFCLSDYAVDLRERCRLSNSWILDDQLQLLDESWNCAQLAQQLLLQLSCRHLNNDNNNQPD